METQLNLLEPIGRIDRRGTIGRAARWLGGWERYRADLGASCSFPRDTAQQYSLSQLTPTLSSGQAVSLFFL
jgi:hypothetical protein